MANKINVNSNYDTIYASKYTYDIESYAIKNNLDLETQSGQNVIKDAIHNKDIEFPSTSNLDYIDSFRDAGTGTSGTAFKDKKTGEIIVAYTGTNPEADMAQGVLTDGASIGLGAGYHYDSAYQFYSKVVD